MPAAAARNRLPGTGTNSGPLLDRIDLHVEALAVALRNCATGKAKPPSLDKRRHERESAWKGQGNPGTAFCGDAPDCEFGSFRATCLKKCCVLDAQSAALLKAANGQAGTFGQGLCKKFAGCAHNRRPCGKTEISRACGGGHRLRLLDRPVAG